MASHHPPDKAGKFTGNSSSGDIVWTGKSNSFEFAFQPLIGFVGIGNDSRFIPLLSVFQCHGFFSYLTSAVALGGFSEQRSQMRISFLGDPGSENVGAAGMLAWSETQICREAVC